MQVILWCQDTRAQTDFVETVMVQIRPFCNSDLPALVEVWVAHWTNLGFVPKVTATIIEQAILSRTFFCPENLLVAVSGESIAAWCHFVTENDDTSVAVMNAICCAESDPEILTALLSSAEQQIGVKHQRIRVGVVRDQFNGYGGLSPIGAGLGLCQSDVQTCEALASRDYVAGPSVQRMFVATRQYRPPVSRDALRFRRTTKVTCESFIPTLSRHASAMSHLDIEHRILLDRETATELAAIDVWFSDLEAEVMECSHAILNLNEFLDRSHMCPEQSYLVSATIQALAERRIATVETVIDADKSDAIDQLAKIGLQPGEIGSVWERDVAG